METRCSSLIAAAALATLATPAATLAFRCPVDSVKVGPVCVDKYEASVWQIPAANTGLINRVQRGRATVADLVTGGATQLGCFTGQTAYPVTFPPNGNWTAPVYAASAPGVKPSACITWFQAEQACALSGKRLLTNQEWQRAAAGTPDNGVTCNTNSFALEPNATGSSPGCVSSWGTFDMAGNALEWVGDWGDVADGCGTWSATFGGDQSCVGGAGSFGFFPSALIRGGSWEYGTFGGIFAVRAVNQPSDAAASFGFRCGH